MITLSIVMDTENADRFLVHLSGAVADRRGLNAELGNRLADELQAHFRARNKEPNKMGAEKTNFWQKIEEATQVASVSETGAVVAIAKTQLRIHLFGGVIRPTGGRKFLTIPLIKEAHGIRVREYEKKSGHKLFRLPGSRVLVERDDSGDRSLMSGSTGTIRSRDGGYRKIGIGAQTKLRVVYALTPSAKIKRDPRALPPTKDLVAALLETGNAWLAKHINSGGSNS